MGGTSPPPPDTKFGNSRCEIVGRRVIFIWSLIHGSSWSGLIKVGPGDFSSVMLCGFHLRGISQEVLMNLIHYMCSETTHICFTRPQWVKGRKWLCYNKIGLFIYSFIYPYFFSGQFMWRDSPAMASMWYQVVMIKLSVCGISQWKKRQPYLMNIRYGMHTI